MVMVILIAIRGFMENSNMTNDDLNSDKVGILLSALCCIHCMAIPFAMLLAPGLSSVIDHHAVHLVGFTIIVPLGLYAFISKLKVHANKKPLYIGLFGMLLLVASMLSHDLLGHGTAEVLEISFSIIGGMALVSAHILNIRLCKCSSCEH